MNLLNRIFSFYVFSNIHVAISVSCLVLLTLEPYPSDKFPSVLFVFCSTVLAYNFIREVEMDRTYPFLANWIRSRSKPLFLLNLISGLGFLYALFQFQIKDLLFIAPFFLLTLLYVYPGNKKFKGLRSKPGLKLFIISMVWAGVTVLFPLVANELIVQGEEWLVFLQRFLLVMAITIPFDIRDVQLDEAELATLPQTLGVTVSKWVALAATAIFASLFFVGGYFDSTERFVGVVVAFLSALLILKTDIYQSRYYSAFWVESIPIAWYLLTLFFT